MLRAASVNPSVKVNAVNDPFVLLDYIFNQLQYDSVRLVKLLLRDITSSIRMARRKTWPEGVVERRGRKAWLKSVAERRGRKAWLKGVVGRRACRIAGLSQMVLRSVASCASGPRAVETVDSPWIATRFFGVALMLIHILANSKKAKVCIRTVQHHSSLRLHCWHACQGGLHHI